ncbi:hypothetical protein [Alkaliphilus hydrothermalis]|uniref:Apea-like HEPN domain-containing protein n=1 Tax=Alkaliphilus hydrothermalis TaxID=1482730 RepID=A0ABS2NSD1_9FIRM|nr:hypothetical protein [Alkaliphilus hydrothermalis]MBM7615677.1 hypothetical protein [Alkaliphilus hydrothermalis]
MEFYAEKNSIENLWHILNLSKQCLEDSYHPNFSSLLSFYSLVELLVLKDINKRQSGQYIHQDCGRKLPYFYRNIDLFSFPQKVHLNKKISETHIFEKLTYLRHKVIHGVFKEATEALEEIFPISKSDGTNMGSTEDAESSAFQDQLQNLNALIRSELGEILCKWMESPEELSKIKQDISF